MIYAMTDMELAQYRDAMRDAQSRGRHPLQRMPDAADRIVTEHLMAAENELELRAIWRDRVAKTLAGGRVPTVAHLKEARSLIHEGRSRGHGFDRIHTRVVRAGSIAWAQERA